MSWERIVLPAESDDLSLGMQIEALLADQRANWPRFRDGEAALRHVKVRVLERDGARVVVQANPGRSASVNARVDPVSIATRPCFLCPDNMPPEERGVTFRDLILCPNPHPIVRCHLTVPSREHRPQRLQGRVGDMLGLARALGGKLFVVYNGPQCGASAPDHFHFQVGSASGVPLLEEYDAAGQEVSPVSSFGRQLLVICGEQPARVEELLMRALTELPSVDDEPLVNIAATYRKEQYNVFLVPRSKHRPECYSAAEPQRVSVSPATLEMMGVLVVADSGHFDRVDEDLVLRVFQEVCLGDEEIHELVERIR
jgi:hypothetical protein